jgi:tripartite-type tricarboxylate transporter receptor subunit TctC
MPHRHAVRRAALFAACIAIVALAAPARAAFPDRPIQLVVPFPAGGTVDVVARKFAESLAAMLHTPVVVVNRDGGSGVIGLQVVAAAQPDGYTLAFAPNGPLTVQPALAKIAYDLASFEPVCQVFAYSYVLVVPAGSAIDSVGALVTRAKSPQGVKFGFGGIGTAPHFAMLELMRAAHVDVLGVPYRGDPPVALSLKSGDLDAAVLTVEVARAQGFRILAALAPARLAALPNVPTAREQGLDVRATTNAGVIAPRNLPADVARALGGGCAAGVRDARFEAGMQAFGQTVSYLDGPAFARALGADAEAKRVLIDATGMRQAR